MRRLMLCAVLAAGCFTAAFAQERLASVEQIRDYEIATVKDIGGKGNPAVMGMDERRYREALSRLHPAFAPTPEQVDALLEFGSRNKKREVLTLLDRWDQKPSGTYVCAYTPMAALAYEGWDAARTYRDADPVAVLGSPPTHYFSFIVNLERSSKRRLSNVTFVLLTEDGKHHQPAVAPDASPVEAQTTTRVQVVPQTKTEYRLPPFIPGGPILPAQRVTTTTYHTQVNKDTTYYANYSVYFDLLNDDGTPRISASAKEVTLIVVLNGDEKRVKFKLADLMLPVKPASRK